jgi:hypothetical protein
MAVKWQVNKKIIPVKKKTSIGRSRLSYGAGMNKSKKLSLKKYRGQG